MGITASCFAQVLSQVDRNEFARAVRRHEAEKASKGFSCWDQFVSMTFCQLGGANSLREIHGGLATAMGKRVSESVVIDDAEYAAGSLIFVTFAGRLHTSDGLYHGGYRFRPVQSDDDGAANVNLSDLRGAVVSNEPTGEEM